jgi:hypothetical protein
MLRYAMPDIRIRDVGAKRPDLKLFLDPAWVAGQASTVDVSPV